MNYHELVVDQWNKICGLVKQMDGGQEKFNEEAFDYKEIKESINAYKNTKYKLLDSDEARKLSDWYDEQKQFYIQAKE